MVCGKHRHEVPLSRFYHYNLRMMARFYVLGLGDPLCRNGFGMMENFVTDLIVVQTIDKLFWDFHERLQSKLSLFPPYLYFGEAARCRGSRQLPLQTKRACTVGHSGRRHKFLARKDKSEHRRKGDGARTICVWLHAKFAKMNMTKRSK